MKLTKQQLKQIIKEEIGQIKENSRTEADRIFSRPEYQKVLETFGKVVEHTVQGKSLHKEFLDSVHSFGKMANEVSPAFKNQILTRLIQRLAQLSSENALNGYIPNENLIKPYFNKS